LRFADQIQLGTFEYTLNHVVDNELDLSVFESRYRNDHNGARAYDPALLLKIVLFAYSRGITSSRKIAQACRENVIFMALLVDCQPYHSTVADFISRMDEVIAPLFTHVQFRKRAPCFIDFTTYAQQQATRRNERDTKHTPNYMERMKHKIDSLVRYL